MKRRDLFTSSGALALGSLLAACGGSGSRNSYGLRLVNASPDLGALDLYADATVVLRNAAYGAATAYASLSSTAPTLALAAAGSTVYAYSTTAHTFSKGNDYTLIAHGWASGPATLQIVDDQDAAASGQTKFRVIHTATDAGAVDVYLTGDSTSLSLAAPVAAAVATGEVSAFTTVAAGSYRLRVVGSGSPLDVRLDLRGVVLPSAGVLSLITAPTSGGVLVDGVLMAQRAAVTAPGLVAARARVVASVTDNARVQVSVGATSVLETARSPAVGSYATLSAGTWPVSVLVDGVAVVAPDITLGPGTDHTIVVTGPAAAPVVSVIADDNRLPRADARCKIRLVHAASPLSASPLSLSVNYAALASGVVVGSASDFVETAAVSDARVEVTDPVALTAVFSVSSVPLVAGAVYTVFMLTGSTGPAGVLRRER